MRSRSYSGLRLATPWMRSCSLINQCMSEKVSPFCFTKTFCSLEEHTLSPQILRRRQCQTLLVFVGLAMKQITQTAGSEKESSVLRDIVSSLLDPSLRDSEPEKSGLQPIVAASRWTLMQTMGTLTVDFFMTTCSAVLSEGNTTVSLHLQCCLDDFADEISRLSEVHWSCLLLVCLSWTCRLASLPL